MLRLCDDLFVRARIKDLVLYEEFLREEVDPVILASFLVKCQPVITGAVKSVVIRCSNTYQRRIIHTIAEIYDLFHARHGEWDSNHERYFDWQCNCRYCWEEAGQQYYRINGVQISSVPIGQSNKDITHRNKELKKNKIQAATQQITS